ncbi:hypothetical protein Q0F99_04540 [Rathayibacter oskolensis]|nr:hypothetical protein [Rathayibacter oskolensis]WKK72266.1 hypothetical protein Q0F99_04540 [Rathayibacter oskolensis]
MALNGLLARIAHQRRRKSDPGEHREARVVPPDVHHDERVGEDIARQLALARSHHQEVEAACARRVHRGAHELHEDVDVGLRGVRIDRGEEAEDVRAPERECPRHRIRPVAEAGDALEHAHPRGLRQLLVARQDVRDGAAGDPRIGRDIPDGHHVLSVASAPSASERWGLRLVGSASARRDRPILRAERDPASRRCAGSRQAERRTSSCTQPSFSAITGVITNG